MHYGTAQLTCERLNIVHGDNRSYKLLLGLASKHLGDIFLHEDFATESETTVMVPFNAQNMKHFLNWIADGMWNRIL